MTIKTTKPRGNFDHYPIPVLAVLKDKMGKVVHAVTAAYPYGFDGLCLYAEPGDTIEFSSSRPIAQIPLTDEELAAEQAKLDAAANEGNN